MKCAVLAVGNELLLGDTLNSNAQTLSRRLANYGLTPRIHLTVGDSEEDILSALSYCEDKVDLLVVTGGLGPTTDDFTREVLCKWAKLKLKFDETSWKEIQDLFAERGYKVHDFQKQQCYFPEGSKILSNRRGTAPGFYFKHQALEIFVLPGPPAEIEAIWDDHIEEDLKFRLRDEDRFQTRSYFCMGPGESQVASVVEPELAHLGVIYGYRTFFPYVEVRIEGSQSELSAINEQWMGLRTRLEEIGVVKDTGSPGEILKARLMHKELHLLDWSPKQSLQKLCSELEIFGQNLIGDSPDFNSVVLGFSKLGHDQYEAYVFHKGQWRNQSFTVLRKLSEPKSERMALEQALWFWLNEL